MAYNIYNAGSIHTDFIEAITDYQGSRKVIFDCIAPLRWVWRTENK